MSIINTVENAIISLDGGKYQKLMDAYLMKKYQFKNIHPLGVQTGTDKPTKGTPDSYVECDDGKYILIMYGSVEAASYKKLESDILSCFDTKKLKISKNKIDKIICAYTSTNLHIEEIESLKNLIKDVEIELIGLGTVAHDIVFKYRFLAMRFLDIPIDSGQVFDIEEFVNQYDAVGMNAPLGIDCVSRETEINDLKLKIMNNDLIIVSGASGIGKTKFVLEACKQIRDEYHTNIVCVKNNGQMLYNDIRETVNDPGKYLLFLDDANHAMNLESIFEFCISKKVDDEIEIKIVMTVRDYAKYAIKKLALHKVKTEEIELKALSEEIIQNILKETFGIKNKHYLKQIIKISKGNIRLAILAAITAKTSGFPAINNATDIFKNFYSPIFNENKITKNEIIVLFAIAIFGPVTLEAHDGIQYILSSNNISEIEYINICHHLNDIELLDMFVESVVKVSDQSLANYILQYVLIEKKVISIEKLLLNTFPKYSTKLIYAINTIIQLFNSETTLDYIKNEIKTAWNLCSTNDEKEYVKSFKFVNEEKALLYVKKIIDNTDYVSYHLDASKFSKEINGIYGRDEIVQILAGFGKSKQCNIAIDLLLIYFSKRPDRGKEIYYGVSEIMETTIHMHNYDYNHEKYLISRLHENYKESRNPNFAILLICIVKNFLAYEFNTVGQGTSPNTAEFITYHINYSQELMVYRKELWKCLIELRKEETLQEIIDEVITNLHTYDNIEAKKIFTEDVSILLHLYDNDHYVPDFNLIVTFESLVNHMNHLGQDTTELEHFLGKNPDYPIYHILSHEHKRGEDWNSKEEYKKKEISNLIVNYGYEEFKSLFSICKKREANKLQNDFYFRRSIEFIFELLNTNHEKYILAMNAYFSMNTPYLYRINDKMRKLISLISTEEIKHMVKKTDKDNRIKWGKAFYEEFPEEQISLNTVNEMLNFINYQIEFIDIQIPDIYSLPKYKNKGINIVKQITDYLLNVGTNKTYVVANFFGRVLDDRNVDEIIEFFEGDTDKLLELYLLAIKNHNFDYDGKLLLRLIQNNSKYWNKITTKCSEINECNFTNKIFDKIWMMDNYHELINIAYTNIQYSYFSYSKNDTIINIFSLSEKTNPLIIERKNLWITEYINKNAYNEDKIKDIFDIIATALPNERLKYIKIFIKENNSCDMFKKISLFPSHNSFWGSEIPLVEEKINFLQKLLNELYGIDFLEHKIYLKELITRLNQYKQNILKKEYIANFSYI